MFDNVFNLYKTYYEKIFSTLYPAKNSTGFPERNLSVNFAKAYESIYPDAISWFEFQFGKRNNLHYDCIIVNPNKKEILIIESKRLSNPSLKIIEIQNDIKRINLSKDEYANDFLDRIENFSEYKLFGIILADLWTETKEKKKILQLFKDSNFTEYIEECSNLNSIEYHTIDFCENLKYSCINKNYHLLAISWQVI